MIRVRRVPVEALTDDVAEDLDGASIFSSRPFMNLWRAAGGEPVCWCAGTDGQTEAVLPGIEFGRRPFQRFQSMPDGFYSRVIVMDRQSPNPELDVSNVAKSDSVPSTGSMSKT